jgi:tRNA-binding protein
MPVTYEDFEKLDIRVGRIIEAQLLPNPKRTTHKLVIDFGPEIGHKISGARVNRYEMGDLVGRLVCGVVNLPERQIGTLHSQVLTLGLPGSDDECVLVGPDREVPLGGRMY